MSSTEPTRPGDHPGPPQGAGPTAAGGPDTGRHAVQRPAPTPPDLGTAPPDPVTSPTAPRPTATPDPARHDPSEAPGPAEHRAADPGPAAERPGTRAAGEGELFPDPHAPRTPHTGSHVLGTLVGLVGAPVALVLLLLGQSRVLDVQVQGWDASLELLGIVLVSAAAVLLAALLALGLWSAAVPTTAGLVLGAVGGFQLYAPGLARAATLDLVGADAWYLTVTQATVAGTSGTTLVVGVLLLTAGVVVALARRHGVHLGEFRERNRVHAGASSQPRTVREGDIRD